MRPEHRRICENIALKVKEKGGRAYYVGGCVRDELMGRASLDTDIEIHGIPEEELEELLSSIAPCREVGRSFGIISLGGEGSGIDVALPRREVSTGTGHRDYDIVTDPWAGEEQSARRRDFTVNAMMKDVLTGEILDFFGGRDDLAGKRLRHVAALPLPFSYAQRAMRARLRMCASSIWSPNLILTTCVSKPFCI